MMKKCHPIMLAVMLSFFLFSGNANTVSAKEANPPKKDTTSQTAAPADNRKAPKTIFDYKSDLNLTVTQEKNIKELLSKMGNEFNAFKTKLDPVDSDIRDLIKTNGDLARLKSKIRESFDIKASMMIVDIETSRKINQVLTPEQLKKWQQIKSKSSE